MHTSKPESFFFYLRLLFGGLLMGLANLVPGISGGTMLLVAGVYPEFIESIAALTRFRFSKKVFLFWDVLFFQPGVAILLGAGIVKELVIYHRWIMYSLFIGLTFGGVPLILKLAKPLNFSVYLNALMGFLLMVWMSFGFSPSQHLGEENSLLLLCSGIGGSSAMILPGVSGGYLLLLLGQYQSILGAIDQLKIGLLGDAAQKLAPDLGRVIDVLPIVLPVGIGVIIGVVCVSNLLKWLMEHYEKQTLGILLGLVLGAVIGIWPFQEGVPPEIGQMIKGQVVTAQMIHEIAPDDWPVVFFQPSRYQIIMSLTFIFGGFVLTQLIERIGKKIIKK